jgi:phenylacetate-coenzyme A ligase PaaK-like adenylate-forming protein
VAFECERKDGLHLNEDCFLVEIVNPTTLEVLPVGSEGELVLTTVTKEGFPLLRSKVPRQLGIAAPPRGSLPANVHSST